MFDAELDYVCHTLRRLGVRQGDVEDVAQNVFVAVHQRFSELDPGRPVRPWLVAFAYRAASNYRRGWARHDRKVAESDAATVVDGRVATDRADQQREVQSVLEELELDRKVVLVMFDIDGFTAPEIAEALELPLNTVYSRIRLARRDFRARWDARATLPAASQEKRP